jgi:hypothetical protein
MMEEGQGFARRITLENLQTYAALLNRGTQGLRATTPPGVDENATASPSAMASAEDLFDGQSLRLTRAHRPTERPRPSHTSSAAETPESRTPPSPPYAQSERGILLWMKSPLPASDVQRQAGNVTGGLRLTQAGWKVGGDEIDHTTYFRQVAFGNEQWTVGIHPPTKREVVIIRANVRILGHDYGLHHFTVSHKPSGEAGQRNYTTMLHWGDLASTIQNLNLTGRAFRLYAPPEGTSDPFAVEIV